MTSGVAGVRSRPGRSDPRSPSWRTPAWPMKPSILPPSTSAVAFGVVVRTAAVHVGVVDVRVDARAGLRVGHAHGRLTVAHRDAVGTRERAEVRVERPVLLHDHDDVLDLVDTRRDDVTACGSARHSLQPGRLRRRRRGRFRRRVRSTATRHEHEHRGHHATDPHTRPPPRPSWPSPLQQRALHIST